MSKNLKIKLETLPSNELYDRITSMKTQVVRGPVNCDVLAFHDKVQVTFYMPKKENVSLRVSPA